MMVQIFEKIFPPQLGKIAMVKPKTGDLKFFFFCFPRYWLIQFLPFRILFNAESGCRRAFAFRSQTMGGVSCKKKSIKNARFGFGCRLVVSFREVLLFLVIRLF